MPITKPASVEVQPTKELFVFVITRDIEISDAVMDLIDNSIDGAKRLKGENGPFKGLRIDVKFDENNFSIKDNCGGISLDIAKKYAFRFGRAPGMQETKGSVGQFGVGMKRALFKFGKKFNVQSCTSKDSFELSVDVKDWLRKPQDWTFKLGKIGRGGGKIGTTITASDLNQEAQQAFSDQNLQNKIFNEIKNRQQLFIDAGLKIVINGVAVEAELPKMFGSDSKLKSSFWHHVYDNVIEDGRSESYPVEVKIYTGIGLSSPEQAGWYVFCNGRAVLSADKSTKTGWSKSGLNVQYHNQFAQFRGYVYFNSDHAGALPWTTTKTDIDETNSLYRQVLQIMTEEGRRVIDFLNALDKEKELPPRQRDYAKLVKSAQLEYLSENPTVGKFTYEVPSPKAKSNLTTISFKRPSTNVDALMKEKRCSTPKQLGESLFDEAHERYIE